MLAWIARALGCAWNSGAATSAVRSSRSNTTRIGWSSSGRCNERPFGLQPAMPPYWRRLLQALKPGNPRQRRRKAKGKSQGSHRREAFGAPCSLSQGSPKARGPGTTRMAPEATSVGNSIAAERRVRARLLSSRRRPGCGRLHDFFLVAPCSFFPSYCLLAGDKANFGLGGAW